MSKFAVRSWFTGTLIAKGQIINRSYPNYRWPLFQSESWCSSFHMKISFNLHVNENSFSNEWMSTRTHFEKEAKGNLEMAYSPLSQGGHIAPGDQKSFVLPR